MAPAPEGEPIALALDAERFHTIFQRFHAQNFDHFTAKLDCSATDSKPIVFVLLVTERSQIDFVVVTIGLRPQ